MEEKSTSVWKISMNYGAILGLVLIIYSVILYVFDLTTSTPAGLGRTVFLIAGLIMGMKAYRDKVLNGNMSYGQALGFGVLMALFASVLLGFYMYLLYALIDPGLMEREFSIAEEKLLNKGMSADQIETQMNMARKFASPALSAIGTLFGITFWGFLLSLIISIFMKKDKNPFEQQ